MLNTSERVDEPSSHNKHLLFLLTLVSGPNTQWCGTASSSICCEFVGCAGTKSWSYETTLGSRVRAAGRSQTWCVQQEPDLDAHTDPRHWRLTTPRWLFGPWKVLFACKKKNNSPKLPAMNNATAQLVEREWNQRKQVSLTQWTIKWRGSELDFNQENSRKSWAFSFLLITRQTYAGLHNSI